MGLFIEILSLYFLCLFRRCGRVQPMRIFHCTRKKKQQHEYISQMDSGVAHATKIIERLHKLWFLMNEYFERCEPRFEFKRLVIFVFWRTIFFSFNFKVVKFNATIWSISVHLNLFLFGNSWINSDVSRNFPFRYYQSVRPPDLSRCQYFIWFHSTVYLFYYVDWRCHKFIL